MTEGYNEFKDEITTRNVLECLRYLEDRRKKMTVGGKGLIALDGMDEAFRREGVKCERLRVLIQGLRSEPVRAGLAKWQRELMGGAEPNLEDLKGDDPA